MASPVKHTFKELTAKRKVALRQLLTEEGETFEKGRAFYQLTKPEIIQDYKEVIVKRKTDGELITGEAIRDVLEIPKSNPKKFKLDVGTIPDFEVFVQSTSYTRICPAGSRILLKKDELKSPAKEATKATAAATTAAEPAGRPARGKRKRADEPPAEEPPADKPPADKPPAAKEGTTAKKRAKNGAGNKVEVAFSFDTTGSMYACLGEVRRGIQEAITRLKKDIPGIRIAVIAHGDYCDAGHSYVTRIQNFSEDENVLVRFVSDVGATGGGDADECYELVLREARTHLAWTPGSTRSLVMIGDCNPHGPNYPLNKQKINWRDECTALKAEDIKVYAVQALNRSEADAFYRGLATLTDGFHLRLDQFSSIVKFMLAICFNEEGGDTLALYETELGGKNRELHRLFDALQGRGTTEFIGAVREDGLVPINPSRFQVLHVDRKCSIKEFVQRNSLLFKAGRGFYEFTKPEIISDKKEVVLVDKTTGDMFTGAEACALIGAGGAGRVKPAALEKWRVFVQSTSYNRVLVEDTGFLYEVDTDF